MEASSSGVAAGGGGAPPPLISDRGHDDDDDDEGDGGQQQQDAPHTHPPALRAKLLSEKWWRSEQLLAKVKTPNDALLKQRAHKGVGADRLSFLVFLSHNTPVSQHPQQQRSSRVGAANKLK